MIIYIVLLFLVTFGVRLIKVKEIKKKQIIFLILFLISALRSDEIGADMAIYKHYFEYFSKNYFEGVTYGLEFGYILLNKIIAILGGSFRSLIFITSGIIVASIYYFYKKLDIKVVYTGIWLLLCLANYQSGFTRIRQAIAVSIIVFSIKYLQKKCLLKFFLMIILASLFHKTALIYILIYFICIKWNEKHVIYFCISIPIVFLLRNNAISISQLEFLSSYTDKYLISEKYITGEGNIFLLIYFILFIFIMIFKKKQNLNEFYTKLSILTVYLMLVFQILAPVFNLFNRVGWYFSYIFFLVLPIFIEKNIKIKSNKKKIYILIYIFTLIFYIYMLINGLPNKTVPYKFVFFGYFTGGIE